MKITVPNNNLRSETQKKVQAAKYLKTGKPQKAYNFKWLWLPVACVLVYEIASVFGTLSLLVY